MQTAEEGVNGPQRVNAFRFLWGRLKEHPLARVGPGLITGVADDDPSGIATYSQAGAQFGLNMLWTMPLAFPLMSAIQSMCARIGRVTGKGLAANIKATFPPIVLQGVVLLLLVANTLNIAADVAAMGEVAELVTGFDRHLMTAFFVFGTLLLQVFIPYHRYVFFLKWLTLSLLAYAAVLFTVHVPWGQVALRTVWPSFTPNSAAAAVVVGVFGKPPALAAALKDTKVSLGDETHGERARRKAGLGQIRDRRREAPAFGLHDESRRFHRGRHRPEDRRDSKGREDY